MPTNKGMNNDSRIGNLEKKIRIGVDDVARNVNAGLRDAGINVNIDDFCQGFLDIGFDIGREIGREFGGGRNRGYRPEGYAPPPPRRTPGSYSGTQFGTNVDSRENTSYGPTAAPKFSMPSEAERLANKNKTKIANLKTMSGLYTALGWVCAVLAGLSFLGLGTTISGSGLPVGDLIGNLIISVVFAACSAIVFLLNGSVRRRRRCYSLYLSFTEGSDSSDLNEIASVSGVSLKRVVNDVYNMIDDGYFGAEASVDSSKAMLYKTRAALAEAKLMEEKRSFAKKSENANSSKDFSTDELDYNSINDFDRIIARIRYLNDEIADADVSERIFKIEAVTTHIFNYIKKHPEKFQSIRSFMSYYLPTTLKLLASYGAIEKAGVAGKNMSEAKESIENTLDMLVEGFSMQLDKLYEDENLDITSDVEVLRQMLAKDGLSRDDFSKFMSGYGDSANS